MFNILPDKTICLTRGDIASIVVGAKTQDGSAYTFVLGDEVRFRILKSEDCSSVVLQKSVKVVESTKTVIIRLDKEDTTIGDIISRPVNYWYEVEVNPETAPQTIVGYDRDGPKIFTLYPEGGDMT